jgi:LPXTG-motif cell wall-anchored protein
MMRKSSKSATLFAGVVICLLFAGFAAAQEATSVEIRSGRVLAVQGNDLIVRGPEGVKRFTVPDDFMFNMNGEMLSVRDLKPGMPIAAKITTIETPVTLTETRFVEGTVMMTNRSALVVKTKDGEIHKFTAKEIREGGFVIHDVNDKVLSPNDLRKGDVFRATVITELPPEIITENELEVFVQQAPPPQEPARRAVPPPPPPKPKPAALPKTGSRLPLIGLLGLVILAAGAALTLARRSGILG